MHRVIAIDGPAASGKSSVARLLAQRLGFEYVNSGALYRALTWHVLQNGVALHNREAIARLAGAARVQFHDSRVLINGTDSTVHLRDNAVNSAVSLVSQVPQVRAVVNGLLRGYARERDAVIEGRDIGSAVFPATAFKFYIDASPEVRWQRRAAQGEHDTITARDELDSARTIAPLIIAPDADLIDTSALSIDEVSREILRRLHGKGLAQAG
ncbi:MAG: (d)CMP kinase [Verrucomicrobia bacterium]|nr:(d)CMP kinase [Verrucomicrobiota bacterium]